MRFIGIGQL